MSWNNTLPAWVFEIPVEKLEQGLISPEEFLHTIKNNPSIPNEVVRNWEDKLKEPNGTVFSQDSPPMWN